MTTKEQNEINQNIGRLDRIKHKIANPREHDTHVRRDRAWLVGEVERLRATGNACHRLVTYLHERDLELYTNAGIDPAPIPVAVAEAGLEEVRRALRLIQKFSSLELEYLQEREAELCKAREAAEAAQKGANDEDSGD